MKTTFLRIAGSIGVVAALSGLFLNLATTPAMYPVLDTMFAAGMATSLGSAVFVGE